MSNKIEDRVKNVMSAVFGIRPEEINKESSLDTIESWDSLNHMNLIISLEEEFNIRFEESEIETVVSYNFIVITLRAYIESNEN